MYFSVLLFSLFLWWYDYIVICSVWIEDDLLMKIFLYVAVFLRLPASSGCSRIVVRSPFLPFAYAFQFIHRWNFQHLLYQHPSVFVFVFVYEYTIFCCEKATEAMHFKWSKKVKKRVWVRKFYWIVNISLGQLPFVKIRITKIVCECKQQHWCTLKGTGQWYTHYADRAKTGDGNGNENSSGGGGAKIERRGQIKK